MAYNITTALLTAELILTSSQVKNLKATPQIVIPAPGSGKAIFVVTGSSKLTYAGSNPFTGGQAGQLTYNNAASPIIGNIFTSGEITQSANNYVTLNPSVVTGSSSTLENAPITVKNNAGSEITGNAANDNTVTIILKYYIVNI